MSSKTYQSAIANLHALIPELYSAPGQPRRKFSLDEIGILCEELGHPQRRFPSVLIAGTNGKGSTAATLAAIGRASGIRVGLYTSPHLERVNERIRCNGEDIADEDFARLYFEVHDAGQRLVLNGKLPALPSFFELLTAVGFLYFASPERDGRPVDLAVLEVGMGGRLDATNIVDPIVSVITDISLDHQEWLGETIDLIAREKAGILREQGTLVTLPQHPLANQAIGEVAMALGVRGVSAADYVPAMQAGGHASATGPYSVAVMGTRIEVDSPLEGEHQHRNLALAIAAAAELAQHHGYAITPASIAAGIRQTRWPGRLEAVTAADGSRYLLDVAHNPAGAWALRAALRALSPEDGDRAVREVDHAGPAAPASAAGCRVLVFACLRDKPLREMTQILFPIFDHVVLAPVQSPRATDLGDLVAAAEQAGVDWTQAATVAAALATAKEMAGLVVVSGSIYLVGEARSLLMAEAAGTAGK